MTEQQADRIIELLERIEHNTRPATVEIGNAAADSAKLAAYGQPAEPPRPKARAVGAKSPQVGEEWDGVRIERVQVNRREGFGVLTLANGDRVKVCLARGIELARKPAGSSEPKPSRPGLDPAEALKAFDNPPPAEEPAKPQVPEEADKGVAEAAAATTFKAAVRALWDAGHAGDQLAHVAETYRDAIPAFAKVAAVKFRPRIERALATL